MEVLIFGFIVVGALSLIVGYSIRDTEAAKPRVHRVRRVIGFCILTLIRSPRRSRCIWPAVRFGMRCSRTRTTLLMTAARLPSRTCGSQEASLQWEWLSHSGGRAVAGS